VISFSIGLALSSLPVALVVIMRGGPFRAAAFRVAELLITIAAVTLPIVPPPGSRIGLVVWQMAFWYGWGALTPLVLWLGRRFPLERRHWWRNALAHVLTGAVVAGIHLVFFVWTWRLLLPDRVGRLPFGEVLRQAAHQQFDVEWLVYWAVLGSGYFLDYYRRYREREVAAAQLERQLAEAQLQALKMQLHPHFLFNTLNTIATLVRKQENDAAVRMLAGLSDLLRYALTQVDKQEVPLKQELEFIEQYLEIEQARFRDRLTVRWQIAPETLAASVPTLILQPLVENAVRHGIAKRAAAGLIEISAWRADETLHLQVRDDGPGLAEESAGTSGVGLANTRARLERLYGADYQFALHNGNGVTVKLAIPFHLAGIQVYGKVASLDRG
jgi:signal transduction histidine kinase